MAERLISSTANLISHTITFNEPTDVDINYAVGSMYKGPAMSPTAGLYYSFKDAATGDTALNNPLETDILSANAADIYTIVDNPITLTERSIEVSNILELTIWTNGSPVLWIDHIQVEIKE